MKEDDLSWVDNVTDGKLWDQEKNTFKVVVAGSRDFNDYNFLKTKLDKLLSTQTRPIEIVSGGARGADKLGERYAKEKGYKLKMFPADWGGRSEKKLE